MSTHSYTITTITPVHVSSGDKILKGLDFVSQNGKTIIIIDMDKLFTKLGDNVNAISEFGQDDNIEDYLRKYKIDPSTVAKSVYQGIANSRDISTMVKTGFGNPYLPGSSIKGAIRTVLLKSIIEGTDEDYIEEILNKILNTEIKKPQDADKYLDIEIFGKDPNYDLMRVLQVSDAEFSANDLTLIETKVLNLKSENTYGWKNLNPRDSKTYQNLRDGTSVYVEGLRENSKSELRIKIDDFLLNNEKTKCLHFNEDKYYFDKLAKIINNYSKKFIKKEIEFFETINMIEMKNFYHTLLDKIPKDEKSFLLHMSWGSGWKGMTGDYLEEKQLEKFRKKFNLGKTFCPNCDSNNLKTDRYNKNNYRCFNCNQNFSLFNLELCPTFPKSRKIVINAGTPKSTMGWVIIYLNL